MRKIQLFRKNSSMDMVTKAMSINKGLESIAPSKEESQTGVSAYNSDHDFHRESVNALLEAEQNKAKAIMCYRKPYVAY
jgi:hypothetical protein